MHSNHSTGLTGSQIEVLILLCRGLGLKQIAGELGLSESAVRARLSGARRKMSAQTTAQVIAEAFRRGALV